jgi:sporulation protein YlmC with PRC-barrel domain
MTSSMETGSTDVARRETDRLIAADRVEGTNVYDPQGNKLGSIDTVMIEKNSGQVAYAVLSFGGFLGIGESHYPLPWNHLRYDMREDGYVVSITEEQLRGAPNYARDSSIDWSDSGFRGSIDTYYGAGQGVGAVSAGPGSSGLAGGAGTTDPRPGAMPGEPKMGERR